MYLSLSSWDQSAGPAPSSQGSCWGTITHLLFKPLFVLDLLISGQSKLAAEYRAKWWERTICPQWKGPCCELHSKGRWCIILLLEREWRIGTLIHLPIFCLAEVSLSEYMLQWSTTVCIQNSVSKLKSAIKNQYAYAKKVFNLPMSLRRKKKITYHHSPAFLKQDHLSYFCHLNALCIIGIIYY